MDDDLFQIGDGLTVGTNPFLTINTSGSVGIGTVNPSSLFSVGSSSQFQVDSTGTIKSVANASWQPLTDSTTALNIANASGIAMLTVNSTGNQFDFKNNSVIGADYFRINDTGQSEGYCFTSGCTQGISVYTVAQGGFDGFVFDTLTGVPYVFQTGNVGIRDTSPDYTLEISSAAAADPSFALSDGDILHGLTDLAETDAIFSILPLSSIAGGAQLTAISETNAQALSVRGVIGYTDPTDSTAAIKLIGAKSNGTTGMADLLASETLTANASETVFQIANNDDTAAFTLMGNGNIGVGNTAPIAKLTVTSNPLGTAYNTGKAALIVDQYESQDLLAASASGVRRFWVDNIGYTYAERFIDIANATYDYYLDPAASTTSLNVAGDGVFGDDVYVTGGEIFLNPLASSTSTTEGTIYYDNDLDHLFLRGGVTYTALGFSGADGNLDDMTVGGTYNGSINTNYKVQIDATGTPDTFKWSDDGGSTWDATGVSITGSAQTLNNGVTVTFGATTGHTLSTNWSFTAQPSAWHRVSIDMTKYTTNNTSVANQNYIELTHNQNTNDLSITAWFYDTLSSTWKRITDFMAKTFESNLDNEFNPEFTQKEKVTTVALKNEVDSLGTGSDGAITVSTSRSINDYDSISGRNCADGGDAVNYSVTALTSTTATLEASPGTGCLAAGDEVLLINLRGTATAYGNVGNWETLRVSSVSTNTVTFTAAKTKYYGDGASDDTNVGVGTGAQDVMLQRVPNYTTVTVNSSINFYPDEWVRPSGSPESGAGGAGEGGVMFFRATGAVSVSGSITTAGRGYIGGAYAGDVVYEYQGDSTTGVGTQNTTVKAEGGGGGAYAYCAGGGGGGYGTAGTTPTKAGTSCSTAGTGGSAYPTGGNSTLTKLYMGSAGGAGGTGYLSPSGWVYDGGAGGDGGGIVYLAVSSISVSGSISANGNAGGSVADLGGTDITPGGGGGGAGGSVKIVGGSLTLGSSLVTAAGGSGGTTGYSNYGTTYADLGGYAYGGNGGTGLVAIGYSNSISGTTSPSYTSITFSYNPFAVYVSEPIHAPGTTAFNTISWTESLPSGTEIQMQTRSGASSNPQDGTWEAWKPTTSSTSLDNANTHTNWTGTNVTVAEGDVARNVDTFEDEDESNSGNLTKTTATAANGYAERTISSTDVSAKQYISVWVRSAAAGQVVKLGLGEAAATEQEKTFYIDRANAWQKLYWDISAITNTSIDAVTKLRVTNITNGNVVYFDNWSADSFLTTSGGSTITSTANNYIQYRAILSTTNTVNSPTLSAVRINLTNLSGTTTIDADSIVDPNAAVLGQTSRRTDPTILEYAMYSTGTGSDGAITVSTSRSINDYDSISGRNCADGGDAVNYSVTALTSTTATLEASPGTGCLAAGDEVLLINLRGTATAYGNVGNWETLRVSSVSTNTVTFTAAKTKYYGDGASDDTNVGVGTGAQDVMLQRVPNYTTVTVNSSINFYPDEWVRPSGSPESGAGGAGEGGVMFFRATGAVSVSGSITTAGRGYIGGAYAGDVVYEYQGDSTTGVGTQNTTVKAEGGGGGAYAYCAGGGGGGYGTAGTTPTKAGTSCSTAGTGGSAYPTGGNSTLTKLYMGSAGGAGGTGYLSPSGWVYDGGAGGDGGGIVYLAVSSISVSGSISANGNAGGSVADLGGTDITPGGGGGGAGGSVKIVGGSLTLGSSLVTAAGGSGGTTGYSNYGTTYADLGGYAYGGNGGTGLVATYYSTSISGTTSPTYTSDTATANYNSYKVYISKELATTGTTSFGNIEWTENLPSGTEIELQTRSGNTTNSTDGTWETWKPTTTSLTVNDANTHTDWVGTNATVAEGDVTRNINYYEDEDEGTAGNLTKFTTTLANGYAERTLGSTNLSSYQYVVLWLRSATAGSVITLGMGETAATEQEKTIKIETADVWQKVYWDISQIASGSRDGITKFRVTSTQNSNAVYLDNVVAQSYLTTNTGSAITSTANNYIQYRAIMTTTSASVTPTLSEVRINYTTASGAQVINDKLSNQNDTDAYDKNSRVSITTVDLDTYKSSGITKTTTGITTNGSIEVGTGLDGDVVISTTRNINTYNSIASRSCVDGGDAVNYSVTTLTSRTASLTQAPSLGCLAVGDEILLINLQGNTTSTINVGNYETLRVESIADNTVRFTTTKTKYYGDGISDDSNIGTTTGNQMVMLQRVPNYNSLVVDSGVNFTPSEWNGTKGGVIFFRAKNNVTINGNLYAYGTGYIGGTYYTDQAAQYQGSSTTGAGGLTYVAKSEGGGGGAYYNCVGGGGGAYATEGATGGRSGTSCNIPGTGGTRYPTYGNPDLTKLYFGSAGGAGGTGYLSPSGWVYDGGTGGDGGGIVYLAANSIVVSGTITANGVPGGSVADLGGTDITPGGGGGGAGGSVKLSANTVNLGSSKVTAAAGSGGTTGYSDYGTTYTDLGGYAYGGAGGTGIISVNYGSSVSGSSSPTYNVAQVPTNSYAVFISDEINTPNATNYSKLTWLADETPYGIVGLQTRSGKSNNATDGSWEAWKPVTSGTNYVTLDNANTHTTWTASDTTLTVADGDITRDVNFFEDEDESTTGNLTKLTVGANANTYAETHFGSTNLANYDFLTAWVYSTSAGNTVKLGFGETSSAEHETLVKLDAASTWQKVYWDISHIPTHERDEVRNVRVTAPSTSYTIYIDNVEGERLMNTAAGSTITSTPNEYIQYRAILASSDPGYKPTLYNVQVEWGDGYKVVQTDSNTVRLYNFSGETQQLRLDAVVFGADLAEWYTVSDDTIEEGDLVAVTGDLDENDVPILRKTTNPNDHRLVGGISTKAGKTLGLEAPNRRLLALAGRIPIKIASDSASIAAGDLITSSREPGRGRKANPGELIMGRALENWTPNLGKDRILVLVQSVSPAPDADVSDGGAFTILTDAWDVINENTHETLTRLGTYAEVVSGKISTGYLESYDLVTRTLSVASSLVSPAARIDRLATDNITPVATDSAGIAISLHDNQTLSITSDTGTPSATFDTLGNATFSAELQAKSIVATDATISGTLYADHITTSFGDINDRFAAVESSLTQISDLVGSSVVLPPPIVIQSSQSALLTDAVTATEDNLTINTDFFVLKNANLSKTKITGSLVIDNAIRFTNNIIDSLGETLYIQKAKLAAVDILDGTVFIDTFNRIFFRGNVSISGNTTVHGVLGADTLAPLTGGNLTIDLGHPIPDMIASESGQPSVGFGDLVIRGTGDKVVARITASGSANLAGDITIEGATRLNGPIQLASNSLGSSVSVSEGQTTLVISGLTLPDTFYSVFVTPSWDTSVWVAAKSTTSVTIRFASAAPAGATMDWLLLLGSQTNQATASSSATLP